MIIKFNIILKSLFQYICVWNYLFEMKVKENKKNAMGGEEKRKEGGGGGI